MDHALFCPQAATSGPKRTEIRSVLWGRGDALEHLQPRPLKRPPKGFGVRRTKTRSQPNAPKALSVRLGPIRCQTPRARSRYTRDASGTPNTTKSEVRSGGADASVTHERTLNRRLQLPGRGTIATETASIVMRTAEMERELRGRASAALFDICVAIHPRSIRPLRMHFPIYNWPAPSISPLLSHNERPLSATIRHR
jgi:hypothetical protein